MSRNASTGEVELEGDFLMNAQGEDVVAGIRLTQPHSQLVKESPFQPVGGGIKYWVE